MTEALWDRVSVGIWKLGKNRHEYTLALNWVESIFCLELCNHALRHLLQFLGFIFSEVPFFEGILTQVVKYVFAFPLVAIDQLPVPLAVGSEIGTAVRVGEVTHEMVGAVGVCLARQLLKQTYPVHDVIRRILCPCGFKNGRVEIHHGSDLFVV